MRPDSMMADRVRSFLKNHSLFGALPERAVDTLIGRGHTRSFAKGDYVCRRGDSGDSLMVLLAGRIKISNVTADAKEVVLNFLSAGDILGEIAALDTKERTADAVTLEQVEAFVVHAPDLLPVLTAHPAALLEMVRVLCERLRYASAIIEDNTLRMLGRTARGLMRLAQQHGCQSKDGIRLNLTVSQAELGHYVSLSRENISRQLGQLREANVVKFDRSQIIITDEQSLVRIASTSPEL